VEKQQLIIFIMAVVQRTMPVEPQVESYYTQLYPSVAQQWSLRSPVSTLYSPCFIITATSAERWFSHGAVTSISRQQFEHW
jgi:hypothetical protein